MTKIRTFILVLLAVTAAARAGTFTAFGPVTYARGSGQPVTERATFAAGGAAVPFTLRIENGGANSQLERVTSATITLNGAAILSPGDFNASTPRVIERTVTLRPSNELTVELRGNPGAGVTVTIAGVDNDPPAITATLTPPPNAAGWNQTPVTVSFLCSDRTSSVVQCPAPVRFDNLETQTTLTVTATDAAGNSGTLSVPIRIDQVPPIVTIEEPSTARTNAAALRIAGSAGDLMGVATLLVNGVPAQIVDGRYEGEAVLQEGANTLTVAATDLAGNSGAASHVIERFVLPQVRIGAPADLAVVRDAAATVTGTVTPAGASVSVNGIPAVVSGGNFTATNIALAQGRTVVTAVATTAQGHAASASILVYRDSIPPRVVVRSPADDSTVYQPSVDVAGVVDDIVVGTINPAQMRVTVNGVAAEVANRGWLARNVALSAGVNTLTITATDQGGNVATVTSRVRYDAAAVPRISILSGRQQSGAIGAELPQPLTVRLSNADGSPAANRTVSFEVTDNNGTVRGGSGEGRRSVAVVTNPAGDASVVWKIGTRAGAGVNRVVARSAGFSGIAEFLATGRTGPANLLVVDSGNQQFGAMGSPAPRPFVAVAVDSGSNRLVNARVTFTAGDGGGSFGGAPSITVTTDTDGRAIALPTLGNAGLNVFTATLDGVTTSVAFYAYARVAGDAAATTITGVIIDNTDLPIPGVSVRVDGSTSVVQADEQGQFTITNAPVGYVKLLVDGSTARRPGTWPTLEYAMYTVAGVANRLEMPIYLLPVDVRRGLFVDEVTGGTLTLPELPGFALTVKPGSATFPGGSRTGTVSVTLVHADKVPMAPGFGQQPRFIVTIQPPGVHFDPPAAIRFPNVDGLAPGEITEMYSFDHDLGQFVSIGTASASADGSVLASDPGVGIIKGGWHCGGNPPPWGTPHCCPVCERCNGASCEFDIGQIGKNCDVDPRPPFTYTFTHLGVQGTVTVNIAESCLKHCTNLRGETCAAGSERWGYANIYRALASGITRLLSGCLGPTTQREVAEGLNRTFTITCVDTPISPTGNRACGYSTPGGSTITITNQGTDRCGDLAGTIGHEMMHAAAGLPHALIPNTNPVQVDCANDTVYPCDNACFGHGYCPNSTRTCP